MFSEKIYTTENLKQKYEHLAEALRFEIGQLKQPLGHGTTSDHLKSILVDGLGSSVPDNAFDGTKSLFDLSREDGVVGAYLFARFNINDLEIITDDDLIYRYVSLAGDAIPYEKLVESFELYHTKRQQQGYPVVLIYDGQGEINVGTPNPNAPVELEFFSPILVDRLKILLVPKNRISELEVLLERTSVDIKPIEILEFYK